MYDLSYRNAFGSKQQKLRVCYEINRISNFAEIEVQDLQKFKNNICMLEGKLFHFLFDSQEGEILELNCYYNHQILYEQNVHVYMYLPYGFLRISIFWLQNMLIIS